MSGGVYGARELRLENIKRIIGETMQQSHNEALLEIVNKTGVVLPTDSEYYIDEKSGLVVVSGTGPWYITSATIYGIYHIGGCI